MGDESSLYVRLTRTGFPDVTISLAAYRLRAFGLATAALDGSDDFVSDHLLDTSLIGSTSPAMELMLADEWRRIRGGYRIMKRDVAVTTHHLVRDLEPGSGTCEEHVINPFTPSHCVRCKSPIPWREG